jgi:DNA-directed RNA polymerase subunit H (RpoH/RPB5)
MSTVKLTFSSIEQMQNRFYNILKLLERRGVIDDIKVIYDDKKPMSIINTVIKFKNIAINFVNNSITTISKNSSIDDFLGQDINMIKILCVPVISKKIYKQVQEYPKGEIFQLDDFDDDIINKDFISEHRIITDSEKKDIMTQYQLNNLPKIQDCEMMARYYNAKVGDVMEVTRYNVNSVISYAYRYVIPGNIDFFF